MVKPHTRKGVYPLGKVTWLPDGIDRGTDRLSGAAIWQLTSTSVTTHNIYGEWVYASTDGERIAFVRDLAYGENRLELWVYDLPTRQAAKIGETNGALTTTPFLDTLYYVRQTDGTSCLNRVHLKTLEVETVFQFERCPLPLWVSATAISPDERYWVGCLRLGDRRYGLYRIDLAHRTWEIFHENEDIFNTHVQYEPSEGKYILVQWNRGGLLDENDNIVQSVGEEGATLYVVDSNSGEMLSLPVGKPYTAPVTGHECWVGARGQVILTAEDGGIYLCAPGDSQARLVTRKSGFGHISASPDGRFFVVDDIFNGVLYVGSVDTGRCFPLCSSGASCGRPQYTHTHPYITPGNRYVIFNSDATGIAQVYAAEIAPRLLEDLEAA